ncbi:MAG: hypothetical protein OXG49_12605 [Chloroflexi bacterium]|nr:hypothetical protein [Chloroflexota bacterium]
MATQDVRMELIQHEYSGVRTALHALMDRMDGYEAALLGLTEMVAENREMIFENSRKLDAIIKHLEVPYKPPAGFVKE